jgi:hypothetical protein
MALGYMGSTGFAPRAVTTLRRTVGFTHSTSCACTPITAAMETAKMIKNGNMTLTPTFYTKLCCTATSNVKSFAA